MPRGCSVTSLWITAFWLAYDIKTIDPFSDKTSVDYTRPRIPHKTYSSNAILFEKKREQMM